MSWLSLMAELGVNINPFVRGMNRARQEASSAGDKMGKDLKNKLWGAFGVGAMAMGVRQLFGDARVVDQLATQFRRSKTEIQGMQYASDRTGLSVGEIKDILDGTSEDTLPHMRDRVVELVEEFKKLETAVSAGAVNQMNRAHDALDRLVLKLRGLVAEGIGGGMNLFDYLTQVGIRTSPDDPKPTFMEWIADRGLMDIADEFLPAFNGPAASKPTKEKVKKERVQKAIRAAKFDLGAEVGNLSADQFAGVGGFIGNASRNSPVVDIAREQLKVQQKIAENTDPEKKDTAVFSPS